MKEVFAYLYETCRRAGLPVGILPIEVSLVVQPEEAADLVPPTSASRALRVEARRLCGRSRSRTSPGRGGRALPASSSWRRPELPKRFDSSDPETLSLGLDEPFLLPARHWHISR